MADYEQYAYRVFISEGLGNVGVDSIRKEVELHFQVTGRKPVVVVDYLQIMAPANERSSDKQNIDKNVLELKRLSRDQKIPIVCISSLNRDNYSQPISMQGYKESGATKVSLTHFKDRDGGELSNISPRRFFCMQCHVPQTDAKPLVTNTFQRAEGLR